MKEKDFKLCSRFHKLGKLKYSLIMILVLIFLGNLCEQIVNIISDHMIILTFREIIEPTLLWIVFGICLSIYSWKDNEKAYYNYMKFKK